jgi:hypothetical protein|tara:strand:+ start:365 stop:532 length:168 start_codon:yes stop_codon:yes gene_type:complete
MAKEQSEQEYKEITDVIRWEISNLMEIANKLEIILIQINNTLRDISINVNKDSDK